MNFLKNNLLYQLFISYYKFIKFDLISNILKIKQCKNELINYLSLIKSISILVFNYICSILLDLIKKYSIE